MIEFDVEDPPVTVLRRDAVRAIRWLLWGLVPVVAGCAWLLGGDPIAALLTMLAVAGFASLASWRDPASLGARLAVAVALMAPPAILLAAGAGHVWQADLHMVFFVALAILAIFADWRTIVAGAGTVALHHLALNVLSPTLVFPGGADLGRVGLHALVVVLEAAALVLIARRIEMALVDMAEAKARAAIEATNVVRVAERLEASQLQAERDRHMTVAKMAQDFHGEVGSVADRVGDTAGRLAIIAGELTERSGAAMLGTEATGQAIGDAASALGRAREGAETMAAAILAVAQRLETTARLAAAATTDASNAERTVHGLTKTARRVAEVTDQIGSVAARTKLLALNATIESARAGEAGQGFAVVATEVKALAAQTEKATREIGTEIAAIGSITSDTAAVVRTVVAAIAELEAATLDVAAIMASQVRTTDAIVGAVRHAAEQSDTVRARMTEVTMAIQQSNSAARSARDASDAVTQHINALRGWADDFTEALVRTSGGGEGAEAAEHRSATG